MRILGLPKQLLIIITQLTNGLRFFQEVPNAQIAESNHGPIDSCSFIDQLKYNVGVSKLTKVLKWPIMTWTGYNLVEFFKAQDNVSLILSSSLYVILCLSWEM